MVSEIVYSYPSWESIGQETSPTELGRKHDAAAVGPAKSSLPEW